MVRKTDAAEPIFEDTMSELRIERTPLIGLVGEMGCGKTTAALLLRELHPEAQLRNFADRVYRAANLIIAQEWTSADKAKTIPTETVPIFPMMCRFSAAAEECGARGMDLFNLSERFKGAFLDRRPDATCRLKQMTFGRVLQLLGTECVRETLGKETWINLLFRDWKPADPLVIADVRFPNEATAVRIRGGVIVRIRRGESGAILSEDGRSMKHASETEQLAIEADYTIENNGSLEDLRARLAEIPFS